MDRRAFYFIYEGKKEHAYHWIHFVKKDLSDVNLEKSSLYLSEFFIDKSEYVAIDNYNHALSIMKEKDAFILFEKLVLKVNHSLGDLFYLPIPNEIFCSEKLYNHIKKEHFTGINFQEID